MGNEQSQNDDISRRRNQENTRQMSEAQVKRLLESQRQQYEKKLEEVAAKAAAQRKQEEANKEAAQRRQEAAAKAAAQSKLQTLAAKATVQNLNNIQSTTQTGAGLSANGMERDRAPYSYSGNQLQQNVAPQPAPAPQPLFNNGYPGVYPNLNQGPSSPNGQYMYNNNNPFRPTAPQNHQDFVFVNNYGQTASYNRPGHHRASPSAPAAPRGPSPRARSVSRNRNSPRDRDVLDCPTCFSRYGMKIFQCENGHSSCNDCKTRGRDCGICKRSITNLRNYDMENHVAQTKAPCPHANEGCKLFIKVIDMENHVKECPFKEQECPISAVFGTCRWKGKLSQISSHFDSMHPSGRETNVDTEMQLTNVRNNSQQVHLVLLGVYNFLLHVKVSQTDGKVYMAVQLIGTKFSAMKWLYEIHVFNKSENRRKYMYTDNCCSSTDKIEDIFKAGECAVLPVWHANTFFNNGAMTYKFFIKKANEEKRGFVKNHRGRDRHQS